MTIQLGKDTQAIIDQAVASGQYAAPEAELDEWERSRKATATAID